MQTSNANSTRSETEPAQQLRRDKRSAAIVLLIITAGLAAILALIGILLGPFHTTDRTNPLYWALLLPFAWWAASLANYTKWATRTLRPAAAIAALTALAALVIATQTTPNITPWLIAAAVTLAAAATGTLVYPKPSGAPPQGNIARASPPMRMHQIPGLILPRVQSARSRYASHIRRLICADAR